MLVAAAARLQAPDEIERRGPLVRRTTPRRIESSARHASIFLREVRICRRGVGAVDHRLHLRPISHHLRPISRVELGGAPARRASQTGGQWAAAAARRGRAARREGPADSSPVEEHRVLRLQHACAARRERVPADGRAFGDAGEGRTVAPRQVRDDERAVHASCVQTVSEREPHDDSCERRAGDGHVQQRGHREGRRGGWRRRRQRRRRRRLRRGWRRGGRWPKG